jgi:hypothetical protein
MRATMLAMTMMAVGFAQAPSKPPKSMPADVGPGRGCAARKLGQYAASEVGHLRAVILR